MQAFLSDQAILLHETGMDFAKLATTADDKNECIELALRILSEAERTVGAVKLLGLRSRPLKHSRLPDSTIYTEYLYLNLA